MQTTYDVRVWPKIQKNKRAQGRHSYTVRWRVAGRPFKRTFQTSALADSERSKLLSAARNGEAFDTESGLPLSDKRTRESLSWYEFACKYVDMKWPRAAATSRRSIAEGLIAVTPVMFTTTRGKPDDRTIRLALRGWGFNAVRRDAEKPSEMEAALKWVARNSRAVSALAEPAMIRAALDAVASKLDGRPAAATTTARKRAVIFNALDYAIELKLLDRNPIGTIKWSAPKYASPTVDPRTVVNPSQARALLNSVGKAPRTGPRLVAFFGTMYFSALRPEEAVNLTEPNLALPRESGWGKLHIEEVAPDAGTAWTNSGHRRDRRQLKHRAVGEGRTVPCPPELTELLQEHLRVHGTDSDGHLFWGERGGDLPSITYMTVWGRARARVFGEELAASSLLARRPYDLRHAAVSTWLASGVEPARVAEWAGHGVDVLMRVYAKYLDGQEAQALQRIERALGSGSTTTDPTS